MLDIQSAALRRRLARARDRIALPAAAVAVIAAAGGCGRAKTSKPDTPPRTQLTLTVVSRGDVKSALPQVVQLVAEQELRRADLHHGPGTPSGVLAIRLESTRDGVRIKQQLYRGARGLGSDVHMRRCCAEGHVDRLRRQLRLLLSTVTERAIPGPRPLWKGAAFTDDQLSNVLVAGAHWLITHAERTGAFELSDLQQVFLILRQSARDPALRRLGARVGLQLARRFLRLAPRPKATDPVAQLFDHAAGLYFSGRLGLEASPNYRKAVQLAFQYASPERLFRKSQPPNEVRDLLDWLVDLYFPFKLGLSQPTRYTDIVARARRYTFPFGVFETPKTLEDRTYLATHVVYVLSDFNECRLQETQLRPLVRFLEKAARVYLAMDDVETLGEIADALKIVGRGYRCPLLRKILGRLLQRQNGDGSWGDIHSKDSYKRYHTTWTAFNGLLEYRFAPGSAADPAIRRAWQTGADQAARPNP
ncbi:MAG: hypothetical protein ABI333_11580 [bacterium]